MQVNDHVGMNPCTSSQGHSSGSYRGIQKNDGHNNFCTVHRAPGGWGAVPVCLPGAVKRILASCNASRTSSRVIRRKSISAFCRGTMLHDLQIEYAAQYVKKNTTPTMVAGAIMHIMYITCVNKAIKKAFQIASPIQDTRDSSFFRTRGSTMTSLIVPRFRTSRTCCFAIKLSTCSGTSGWLRIRGSSRIRSGGRVRMICFARSMAFRCDAVVFSPTKTANPPKRVRKKRVARINWASMSKVLPAFFPDVCVSSWDPYQNSYTLARLTEILLLCGNRGKPENRTFSFSAGKAY